MAEDENKRKKCMYRRAQMIIFTRCYIRLYSHVNMCAHEYIRTYICAEMNAYEYTHTWIHTHRNTYKHEYTHTWIYAHMNAYEYVYTYRRKCWWQRMKKKEKNACTDVHKWLYSHVVILDYIHTWICAHKNIYAHTYVQNECIYTCTHVHMYTAQKWSNRTVAEHARSKM